MENDQNASGDKHIFKNLSGDDPEPETTEIESLCINCNENGITRLLLTKIPFYKEVVIMSFECEKCGYRNNEIQPGGKIEEKGVRITLKVENEKDLNRQVVKSDYTSIKVLELDFEIPSRSQKGEVTTVEGVIDRSIAGLQQDQPERRTQDPDTAVQIDLFLAKLQTLKFVETPFTMVLEDISGNTFIQNPAAPEKDPGAETVWFTRTKEQDHILGIYTSKEIGASSEESDADGALLRKIQEGEFTYEDLHGEVLQFPTFCPDCGKQCPTNMKVTNIPYFKDVLIIATTCECGHRSNEVKSGGGIEPKGVRIEVKITSREDFSRDLLKSETCSLEIPELKLSVGPYALSGRFTTVEGILAAMREQLSSSGTFFQDSADPESKARVANFIEELVAVMNAEKQVTLVLDDPAGNSHVQSFTHPEPDPNLIITHYERTFEHNEELGLNDMKTENYSEDS